MHVWLNPWSSLRLKIQMGNEQKITTWLRSLKSCFAWPVWTLTVQSHAALLPWALLCGCPSGPSSNLVALHFTKKAGNLWCRARLPWWASGNRMIRLLNDSNFKAKYYFMKGLHSQSDEYGISNPVLLSCQAHLNGVRLQYASKWQDPPSCFRSNNEEMDVFNIKPICLLLS